MRTLLLIGLAMMSSLFFGLAFWMQHERNKIIERIKARGHWIISIPSGESKWVLGTESEPRVRLPKGDLTVRSRR